MTAQPDWPALKARVSNRLSRHFCTAPFRLRNARPMVSFTFDDFPEERGRRRRPHSRPVRCRGDVLCLGRSGRQMVRPLAGSQRRRDRGACTGAATRSPATRFRMCAPPISMRRHSPPRSRRNRRYLLASILRSRSRILPILTVWDRYGAKAQLSKDLPVVPRHCSRRQQRGGGSAVPALHPADRSGHRPRRHRSRVRRGRRHKRLAHFLRPRRGEPSPAPMAAPRPCCGTRWMPHRDETFADPERRATRCARPAPLAESLTARPTTDPGTFEICTMRVIASQTVCGHLQRRMSLQIDRLRIDPNQDRPCRSWSAQQRAMASIGGGQCEASASGLAFRNPFGPTSPHVCPRPQSPSASPPPPDALSVLNSVFGLPAFRGAQEEIIGHVTEWRQLPGADADRRRQVAVLSIAGLVARGLRHRRLAPDRADARPGRGAARGRRQGRGSEFHAYSGRGLRGRGAAPCRRSRPRLRRARAAVDAALPWPARPRARSRCLRSTRHIACRNGGTISARNISACR